MKYQDRYTVPIDEDFEPDSNQEVLKNYLCIKTKEKIETLEKQELGRTELELIKIFDENSQFKANDICNIHKLWLGDIYPLAGKYRTVRMEKNGFPFAMPNRIALLMAELETKYLTKFTPCHFTNLNELALAIHAGVNTDYQPMQNIFIRLLEQSLI